MSKPLAALFKRIIYIKSWMNISSSFRFGHGRHTNTKSKGYDIESDVFDAFAADSKVNPAVVSR